MENEVKEPAPKYDYVSREVYLTIDRASELRYEYYEGQIYPMSACSLPHNTIEVNIIVGIGNFLKDKDCRVLPSHIRVSTPSHDSYMYPDASIACGEPVLEDNEFDTLLNSAVIFEILSPSTRNIDKGEKLPFYKQIPTLKGYIMADSLKRLIQVYRRLSDFVWKFEELNDQAESLHIQTINYSLPLSEIYHNAGL